MLYFVILNVMEVPHTVVVFIRLYEQNIGASFSKDVLSPEADFYLWYICRGIVLPVLRLIEPQFW